MGASLAKTHENYAHTWWTPPEWLRWVTATLGNGWFDPCPQRWRPGDGSGLGLAWGPSFYCNHPGARGSTSPWWEKFISSLDCYSKGVWCAFSVEQLRHMRPSPFHRHGWLTMPSERIGFIWGGPTLFAKDDGKGKAKGVTEKPDLALLGLDGKPVIKRQHGERATSPGNWTVFWSSVKPAKPPVECIIVRTGQ